MLPCVIRCRRIVPPLREPITQQVVRLSVKGVGLSPSEKGRWSWLRCESVESLLDDFSRIPDSEMCVALIHLHKTHRVRHEEFWKAGLERAARRVERCSPSCFGTLCAAVGSAPDSTDLRRLQRDFFAKVERRFAVHPVAGQMEWNPACFILGGIAGARVEPSEMPYTLNVLSERFRELLSRRFFEKTGYESISQSDVLDVFNLLARLGYSHNTNLLSGLVDGLLRDDAVDLKPRELSLAANVCCIGVLLRLLH
eukprot:GHVQ01019751.1.p1 GENE.GHVQ01019751.1~~GHVQ01019751.1.p1  ORF type:complete len:254 (+),score=24.47 GHVQ01019751.1:292-1053(+)